jgi:hypothetical protein
MNAFLLHNARDFDMGQAPPEHAATLIQDLGLHTLFNAMACGDKLVFDTARVVVLSSLIDPTAIAYRQHVLADCIEQASTVREVYAIAGEAIAGEHNIWRSLLSSDADALLGRSLDVMRLFVGMLERLRGIADAQGCRFRSTGFMRFFTMLAQELDDAYFHTVNQYLKELEFPRGVLISAELGDGNKGTKYVLRQPREQSWQARMSRGFHPGYSFRVPDGDENSSRLLAELRGEGINLVAGALSQATEHMLRYFQAVRSELAFYVGALNLHTRLTQKGEPVCFPIPLLPDTPALSAQGLYDVCLSVGRDEQVVGNDLHADGKRLIVITGANQGGKSTFLRSVGVAHLMMQCGLFVPATSFRANLCSGVFTHFTRDEDATLRCGKLDEELSRMSGIVDKVRATCMVLCNESFAATNEQEGSEIARPIVRALVEAGVKVFLVTHSYDLAYGLYCENNAATICLRAERQSEGRRTFKLRVAEPLPTSYGADLYARIFGVPRESASGRT